MKLHILLIAVLCILLATSVMAKKKSKKHEKKHEEKLKMKDELDLIAEDEMANDEEKPEKPEKTEREEIPEDPCANFHCGAGKQCDISETGSPKCVCVRQCPSENDDRRKICSNHNETWDSDCELYRMRCLCDEEDEQCEKKKYKHAHVDYYGACREIEPCTSEEMEDFPRRMRDWLLNVMKDLADRHELEPDYEQLEREAETSLGHKWVNAVIWKFCDLDSRPHDRAVSRHELFPIRAPLLAMEHCIAPFLDGCDSNDDHKITLVEWGKCLGLEEEEIQNKCPKGAALG